MSSGKFLGILDMAEALTILRRKYRRLKARCRDLESENEEVKAAYFTVDQALDEKMLRKPCSKCGTLSRTCPRCGKSD